MDVLHLDFETASGVDLKKVGVENYCRHPDFAVTVVAWAWNGGPVQSWRWPDTHSLPPAVLHHIQQGGTVKAWNAAFEWNVLALHYNVSPAHEQMDCVMQRASAWGLPMSLQDAGDALNLGIVKDASARRLMLTMGKPKKDGSYWHITPTHEALQKLDDLTAYCEMDVAAERELDKVIPPLARFEKLLSVADAKINQKGVLVDLQAVEALKKAVTHEKLKIDRECATLTGGAVTSPGTQTAMLMAWLLSQGCVMGGLTKADVAAALKRPLSIHVNRVLELRQKAARASVAKLERMAGWASTGDGRARNLLQFYGAGRTGRWAGRGIQVQNLPRPPKDLDTAAVIGTAAMMPDALGLFHEDPLKAISGSLRACLTAKSGHLLVSIDLSQIEARVLAWLAGQQDVVAAFANNIDVYTMQAAKVGSTDRQLGKVLVLACGYGMGAQKFMETANDTYGMTLDYAAATFAHTAWRLNNAAIVQFWYALERIVDQAVLHPGKEVWGTHGVAALVRGNVLLLRKPNGVKLAYHDMRLVDGGLVFDGVNGTTKTWGVERTYGGRLVENLVQSVARDVMAEAILAAPMRPIVTVHDEIVWEVEDIMAGVMAGALQAVVETVPLWAAGLPLASDAKVLRRYGK